MSTFIEARVIQKVDTEANWLSNPLKLYSGEVAYVSDKNNFKLNQTSTPKTFAELDYYYKGDILGSVAVGEDLTSKPSGVYRVIGSGTIGGVVVKEGYYTLLRKDNGVWKLESEVKMPSVDIDGNIIVGQTTKAVNGDKIAQYVGNTSFSNFIQALSVVGYDLDAVVYYNEKLYKSLEPDNKSLPTDTTKWKEIKLGTEVDQEFNIDSENAVSAIGISEYLGTKPLNVLIGVKNIGSSTASLNAPTESYFSNSSCKTDKPLTLKSIVTNFSVGGAFKVVVTSEYNKIIYTSIELIAEAGEVKTDLPDIKMKANEIVWMVAIPNTTASIKFGESGVSGNHFMQRNSNGGITNGVEGSYYSFYFNAVSENSNGVLGNYISKSEAEGYENIGELETFGSNAYNTSIGNQPVNAYYILKIPFETDKTIQKLSFHCGASGVMTFVIGELDQANKFIERSEFSVNVVSGINNITIDKELKISQYIGVKTAGLMPSVDTNLQHSYTWGVEGSYTNPLTISSSWSLGLSIDVRTRVYTDDSLARMSDIKKLQNQIESFEVSNIWTSPDGIKWRVGINNLGQFTSKAVGRYTKILHLGNSILVHSIVNYWWGFWGMAAKTREDDYAHRFLAKIRVANPNAESWESNIAEWEQNPTGYNKSNLDELLTAQTYDLVVIRLGENATSVPVATYKTEFRNLINYIQAKVPTARIIVGGMFWINGGLENAMKEIAIEKGLTFSSMEGLDIASNKSFIGDIVQGDDGQSHAVDNQGVANHPNNNGMEEIAKRLFASANS